MFLQGIEWLPIPLAQRREVLGIIERPESFAQIGKLAIEIAARLPGPLSIVIGPITSGTDRSIEQALATFNRTITWAESWSRAQDCVLFDQMPLEGVINQCRRVHWPFEDYCWPIILDIYLPLFEAFIFKRHARIPGYDNSKGASFENYTLMRLGSEPTDTPTV
jgi:hypothetical protein